MNPLTRPEVNTAINVARAWQDYETEDRPYRLANPIFHLKDNILCPRSYILWQV